MTAPQNTPNEIDGILRYFYERIVATEGKTFAGDPQYAADYFSRCLCGKKRKVTTVKEVDA